MGSLARACAVAAVAVCSISVGTASARHVVAVTEIIAKDIVPLCTDSYHVLTLNSDFGSTRRYVPGHLPKKFTDDFKAFVTEKHCAALPKGTIAGFNEAWQTVKIVEMSGAIIILKNDRFGYSPAYMWRTDGKVHIEAVP
ncbi:MAG TPA: hypothetical protein VME47_22010 [Acetobacteraceae bacterium]|nr:hypothetical protein [Acetobacteraceae bacterium]